MSWPSGSVAWTTTTTTRPDPISGGSSPARSPLRTKRGSRSSCTAARRGDDTFAILAAEGVPERTVLHCFTGGVPEAERALEIGAYISFSGIVSFPKAPEVREAAARCPADRVLVETDAPFLAPVPLRGRPNSPAYVPLVGAALAQARGIAPEDVAAMTTANAVRAFGLDALVAR